MNDQQVNSLYKAEDILKQLQSVSNLPPIPKVLQEISQLFNSPTISARKVEMMVEKDPSLTVKVLSVANSPLYGLRRNVTSINTAVILLGMQEIKSIVTSIRMASTLKMKSDKYFNPDKFLNHSMVVGMLAQRMSKDLGFNFEGDGFVAGMLHDMGILIIHEYLSNEFLQIVGYSVQNKTSFLEAEYKVLGLSHQEIGEFLTDKWSLPTVFSDALQFHHRPSKSNENNFLTAVLHVADYATCKFLMPAIIWDENYRFDDGTIELLNFLSPEGVDEFIEAYKVDYLEAVKAQVI
jgi:HD-like signal output (HDOD) protein